MASRGRIVVAVALATALVVGNFVSPPPTAAAGTLTEFVTSHGGVSRDYWEYRPNNLPGGARPLVIVLHGGTQTAEEISTDPKVNGAAYFWRTLADEKGFIVVYPNARLGADNKQNWNDCRSEATRLPNSNDVGFIDQVITEVSGRHSIDSQRVYASGASNGGMMAYRLALELSHKIAAVGAVAANMAVDPYDECPNAPANPISVSVMNGDGDPMMPFNGGCVNGDCPYDGQVQSTQATVDFWKTHNATTAGGSLFTYPNPNTTDRSIVERRVYTGGSQGTAVPYFKVVKTGTNGAGHATPSLCCHITWGVELIVKKQNKDIEGIREFWNYLDDHTLTT